MKRREAIRKIQGDLEALAKEMGQTMNQVLEASFDLGETDGCELRARLAAARSSVRRLACDLQCWGK